MTPETSFDYLKFEAYFLNKYEVARSKTGFELLLRPASPNPKAPSIMPWVNGDAILLMTLREYAEAENLIPSWSAQLLSAAKLWILAATKRQHTMDTPTRHGRLVRQEFPGGPTSSGTGSAGRSSPVSPTPSFPSNVQRGCIR